jgi:hypothetical protein
MATLIPVLTGTPGQPPSYNVGMAETFSWIPVDNDVNRPLFARAGYITNLKDITISLSASEVTIGGVEITDGSNHAIKATVSSSGTGTNSLNVVNTAPVALKDATGNNVSVVPATSSLNVNVTNPIVATVAGSGIPVSFAHTTNFDAFGRLRTSNPLTLFDSSHRYQDNSLWNSLTAVGGSCVFNQNQGLVDLTVNSLSGSCVARETTKVFSYQAGKSMLVMNTFVMAPSANNLQQRVGYFGQNNGIYLQLDGSTLSFVERTGVNGGTAQTVVPMSAWNGDQLNGQGPSKQTLDITKAQIFWMDIEWLGVGTVRTGFVINGEFVLCHSFHHANLINSTYITTACLPLRYEITNLGATGGSHTLKQICSTVISEGGYELRGTQQAAGTLITAPKDLPTAGTLYPVVSIRLKSARPDAIVIVSALSVLGITNNVNYNWKLVAGGTTSGGSGWTSAGANSSVEYRLDATSITGGRILANGFTQGSNQGSSSVDILRDALFRFQLERDSFGGTMHEMTLVVAAGTDGADVLGSLDWEEISR